MIVECSRGLVGPHSMAWDEWMPQVAAVLNDTINESTGGMLHFIEHGVDKTTTRSSK